MRTFFRHGIHLNLSKNLISIIALAQRNVKGVALIPQFLVDEKNLVVRAGGLFQQQRHHAADAVGALAVKAPVALYGAGGAARKALTVARRSDVSGAGDSVGQRRRELISPDDQIHLFRTEGNCGDAVACSVDVDDFARFGNAVDGADIDGGAGGGAFP